MWCNQIFSVIQKRIVIKESTEEFNLLVEEYLKIHTDSTVEEAQKTVLSELDTTEKYVVANTFVCDNYNTANTLVKSTYGEEAFAVDTTRYPVAVGNEYRHGFFYDENGAMIFPNPTEDEKISALEVENAKLKEAIAELEECIIEITSAE